MRQNIRREKATVSGILATIPLAVCFFWCAARPLSAEEDWPLSMKVACHKDKYVRFEPVYAIFTISNDSEEAVEFLWPNLRRLGLDLTEQWADGSRHKPELWGAPAINPGWEVRRLEAGQSIRYLMDLRQVYKMVRDDTKYVLKADFDGRIRRGNEWVKEKMPARTEFAVVDDTDEVADVYGPYFSERMEGPMWPKNYVVGALIALEFYPDIAYAEYAYYWIGQVADLAQNQPMAVRSYERQLEKHPDFPLNERIRVLLIEAKVEAGMMTKEEARGQLRKLLGEFKEIGAISRAENYLKRIEE